MTDEALAGATVVVNISASPYHAGKGVVRERMIAQRARDHLCAVAFCALVGGQDELVFDGALVRRRPRRRRHRPRAAVRRGPAHRRRRPAGRRVGAPARHAPPARGPRAARGGAAPRLLHGRATARREAARRRRAARSRRCSTADARSTRRSCSARATTSRRTASATSCSGLSGGIDSTLVALIAVDALGADQVTRRDDAVPVLLLGHAGRRARASRDEPRRRACSSCRSRRAMGGYDELLRRAVRGPRARHHRGEPPGPHPRQPADGAVEQVRLARADDRQQVRDVRRLLDALRRQRRRLRRHQGRARSCSSTGSSTCARPARGRRARPAGRSSRAPPSAELRPDQRDEDSLPPYEILDAILEGYVEQDLGPRRSSSRAACPRRTSTASSGSSTSPSTSAASTRPGIKVTAKAFGRDRRVPITNRYGG